MSEHTPRRYGEWRGNPKGAAEDTTLCIKEVHGEYRFHQCCRKRGHGPDGLYCKQHGKKQEEKDRRPKK